MKRFLSWESTFLKPRLTLWLWRGRDLLPGSYTVRRHQQLTELRSNSSVLIQKENNNQNMGLWYPVSHNRNRGTIYKTPLFLAVSGQMIDIFRLPFSGDYPN